MSYEKQTWASGDVITATKMNHIEDGIKNNSGDLAVVTIDLTDYSSDLDFYGVLSILETHNNRTMYNMYTYLWETSVRHNCMGFMTLPISDTITTTYTVCIIINDALSYFNIETTGGVVASEIETSAWNGSWSSGASGTFIVNGSGTIKISPKNNEL